VKSKRIKASRKTFRYHRQLIKAGIENNWLKDNLENPLRHWEGNEFIETEERKDIFMAMQRLYEDMCRHK